MLRRYISIMAQKASELLLTGVHISAQDARDRFGL